MSGLFGSGSVKSCTLKPSILSRKTPKITPQTARSLQAANNSRSEETDTERFHRRNEIRPLALLGARRVQGCGGVFSMKLNVLGLRPVLFSSSEGAVVRHLARGRNQQTISGVSLKIACMSNLGGRHSEFGFRHRVY